MSYKRNSTPIPSPRANSSEDLDTIELAPLVVNTVPSFATRSYSVSLRSDSFESVKSRSVYSQTDPQLDPNFVRKTNNSSQTDPILLDKSDFENLASKTDIERLRSRVTFQPEGQSDKHTQNRLKNITTSVENTHNTLCWCLIIVIILIIIVVIIVIIILQKLNNGS